MESFATKLIMLSWTVHSHSEKQWSDQMLDTLTRCGERASQRQAVQSEDFATLLHREWLKCYPNSSLSARHLKSRLNVYQRTRSEAPPASKRRKVGDYRAADDDPSCDDAHRKPSTLSCNDADEVSGGTVADTVLSSPETGTGDENASQDTAIAKGNWACVKHRLHVFKVRVMVILPFFLNNSHENFLYQVVV